MGAIFSGPKAPPTPVAPAPLPPPPRNVTVGGTAINRQAQRRRSSLANAAGQNRTLLNSQDDTSTPLGL